MFMWGETYIPARDIIGGLKVHARRKTDVENAVYVSSVEYEKLVPRIEDTTGQLVEAVMFTASGETMNGGPFVMAITIPVPILQKIINDCGVKT